MSESSLLVRCMDFNNVATKPNLLKKLRQLTLYSKSGMNYELNNLLEIASKRKANALVVLGYYSGNLVAWSLMSREDSKWSFPRTSTGFSKWDGILYETFVSPYYRRRGFGTKLMQVARRKAGSSPLCIVPWDYASMNFYSKFENYNHKKL